MTTTSATSYVRSPRTRWYVVEVARLFGVPEHLIADVPLSTYGSGEKCEQLCRPRGGRKPMKIRTMLLAIVLLACAVPLLATDVEDLDSAKYRKVVLQAAQTTGNGVAWDMHGNNGHVWVRVEWSKDVSAGAVVIEGAEATTATGTWEPMAPALSVAQSAAACGVTAPLAAACRSRFDFDVPGAMQALRARISTTVSDGTVTVTAYAAR